MTPKNGPKMAKKGSKMAKNDPPKTAPKHPKTGAKTAPKHPKTGAKKAHFVSTIEVPSTRVKKVTPPLGTSL